MSTRILIADDHQVIIDGLSLLVNTTKGFEACGTAKDGWEVIEFLEKNPQPDILLMDITMPELDGMETMGKLQVSHPDLSVIILSMHLSGGYARTLLSLGVKGYLQKDCDKKELQDALCTVRDGGTYLSHNITDLLVKEGSSPLQDAAATRAQGPKITKREQEILELIAKEHPTREIAELLDISFNTVETHRKHLLNKFAVKSTVGLIQSAMRCGMLE